MSSRKYGANVFEIATRMAINNDINGTTGVADRLADHQSGSNSNAHQINNINGLQGVLDGKSNTTHTHTISDVTGLQSALDGKQNVTSGYTGIIDIVVSVDFKKQISSTAKINVSNGIIISIN